MNPQPVPTQRRALPDRSQCRRRSRTWEVTSQAAARQGFVQTNPLTGELELSSEGEALVDAVGEAKARAAQEGPVVWPGAAVDVVLGWRARNRVAP